MLESEIGREIRYALLTTQEFFLSPQYERPFAARCARLQPSHHV
jgi:hypothetical protein